MRIWAKKKLLNFIHRDLCETDISRKHHFVASNLLILLFFVLFLFRISSKYAYAMNVISEKIFNNNVQKEMLFGNLYVDVP